jgi:hypothetical protein
MTLEEFSNGFDSLVASYRRFKDFDRQELLDSIEFDEYEKSQFLTKSQEELVEALYAGESLEGESYEETERLRRKLSSLNEEKEYTPMSSTSFAPISSHSQFFETDPDILFITYEAVGVGSDTDECLSGKTIETVPVRQDWFHRQVNNPFRGISKKRALRLDKKEDVKEIVYPLTIQKYYVRYVRKPQPIVLEDLPNGLTVGGKNTQTECELDSSVHQKILENAVILALRSKGLQIDNNRERRGTQ